MAPLNQERHDVEHDRMEIEGNYRSQPAAHDLYLWDRWSTTRPMSTVSLSPPLGESLALVVRLNGFSADCDGNAVRNDIRHAPSCVLVESWPKPPVTFRRDVTATQRAEYRLVGSLLPTSLTSSIVMRLYFLLPGCPANCWECYGWFNTRTEPELLKAVLFLCEITRSTDLFFLFSLNNYTVFFQLYPQNYFYNIWNFIKMSRPKVA